MYILKNEKEHLLHTRVGHKNLEGGSYTPRGFCMYRGFCRTFTILQGIRGFCMSWHRQRDRVGPIGSKVYLWGFSSADSSPAQKLNLSFTAGSTGPRGFCNFEVLSILQCLRGCCQFSAKFEVLSTFYPRGLCASP